jgi:Sec-independent protein secretion pathway component TatC
MEALSPKRRWIQEGWFTFALLAVIIGIELAFPSWSKAQLIALAVTAVFFGSILAWRTVRRSRRDARVS